jgi:hypothetical protein
MSRKYAVSFPVSTRLSPSVVYVSTSNADPGKFSASVLHSTGSSGSFESPEGISKAFDLHQGERTFNTEKDALDWACEWLNHESGCSVSINEIKQ